MKREFARGLADALDRVGATVVALSLIGTWFTEQITLLAGVVGVISGTLTVALGVYTKVMIDEEGQS